MDFKVITGDKITTFRQGYLYAVKRYGNTEYNFGYYKDGYSYPYRIGTNRYSDISEIHEAMIIFKNKILSARITTFGSRFKIMLFNDSKILAENDIGYSSLDDVHTNINSILAAVIQKYNSYLEIENTNIAKENEKKAEENRFRDIGKTIKPQMVEIVEEEIELNINGNSTQEKFISIVGEISELTQSINQNTTLGDNKDIVESFIKAKTEIEKLISVTPNKVSGFFGKYFGENKYVQKVLKSAKDIKAENDSIQNNINHLFGVIFTKYEKLVTTGEALQKTKALLVAQVDALENLLIESNAELAQYANQVDIPMRDVQLNTQIKASVEKYRSRLTKIDGAIMATRTTIIALGKELPAMKTDLTDEMAIGSLLSNVDDYQHMFQEIADLVSTVAKSTAEQTHTVIENLLEMQINDTHTMQYLEDSAKRGEKFATMISDKSQKLAKKVQRDAEFIADIAKGNSIEHARSTIKLLN